jgi:hypothetical protein
MFSYNEFDFDYDFVGIICSLELVFFSLDNSAIFILSGELLLFEYISNYSDKRRDKVCESKCPF